MTPLPHPATMPKSRWQTPRQIPLDTHSPGPRVLATGLWRTGTSSLQTAFESHLSPPLRPSMHGTYLLTNQSLMKLCVAACNEPSTPRRRKILRQVFEGYNASSDFPGMAFVDDLLDMYPDALVILNTRSSADAWERSANEVLRFWSTHIYALVCGLIPTCRWHFRTYAAYTALAKRRFRADTDIWSRAYYETHNEWVREECRKRGREWLEWRPEQGWEGLCGFLGRDVPAVEFPRDNDASEIRRLRPWLVAAGVGCWVAVVGVCWGSWVVGRRAMGW